MKKKKHLWSQKIERKLN